MGRHDKETIEKLIVIAKELRMDVIKMLGKVKTGHPGGSLSAADIVSALYFHQMRVDPRNPRWEDRDRLVLSKGHAAPVVYAALAKAGFFPREELWTLRQIGSILQGHPDMNKTPGIDMTSGSLGQGLSVGIGMALGGRLNGKSYRVYVLLGCGEIQEGQVWEAAMAAVHYKIDTITAIMDYNAVQLDGPNAEVMSIEPVIDKWRSFGWKVFEIDGHNMGQILDALDEAVSVRGGPAIVVAHTVKGKGVSFMEGKHQWHGAPMNDDQAKAALEELMRS
ncbi:MAG: transketolase [bacterium]